MRDKPIEASLSEQGTLTLEATRTSNPIKQQCRAQLGHIPLNQPFFTRVMGRY